MPFPWAANDPVAATDLSAMANTRVVKMVFGETISAGDALYFKSSDSRVWKTSAAAAGEAVFNFIGWAGEAGVAGNTKMVFLDYTPDKSGLTSASFYYLSDTAGAISTTPGTIRFPVGRAVSTTVVYRIQPTDILDATISDNSAVATSGGAGTNTDTVVTHGLTRLPRLIYIYATLEPNTTGATTKTGGFIILNGSGTQVGGMTVIQPRSSGTPDRSEFNVSTPGSLSASGSGGTAASLTISILSITATQFTFRINSAILGGAPANGGTVTGIRWIVIG